MKKLTECLSYKEVVSLIKEREWTTTEIASKCWHYHQNIALAKTEETAKSRVQVYKWLCKYQEEYHIGNKPSKHKDFIVGLLLVGQAVTQIYDDMIADGFTISKSVIYKYKREVEGNK